MANTMPEMKKGRALTAATSKAIGIHKLISYYIGLNEELINQIGENEDLHYLLKLHTTVQTVKSKNIENAGAVSMLHTTFDEIHEMLARLQKAQSKSSGSTVEKKKDDKGKSGKKK